MPRGWHAGCSMHLRTNDLTPFTGTHGAVTMKTNRIFANAALLAALCHTLVACTAQTDSELADDADDIEQTEETAEDAAPLVNGTATTDFAPVVRITWSKSYSCGFLNLSTCT